MTWDFDRQEDVRIGIVQWRLTCPSAIFILNI